MCVACFCLVDWLRSFIVVLTRCRSAFPSRPQVKAGTNQLKRKDNALKRSASTVMIFAGKVRLPLLALVAPAPPSRSIARSRVGGARQGCS